MKAVSSTELGLDTMTLPDFEKLTTEEVIEHLHVQDSERAFCVYEALKRGVAHDVIYDITKIDWWFLDKLQHLADIEMGLKNGELTTEKYLNAKRFGFLDKTIKRLAGVDTLPEAPKAAFKMVDTCAAEFAAKTPYFYSTYDEDNEAKPFIAERSDPDKKKVLVFGSGPIRIGQGIEFDYCSVHAVWTLKQHGCEAILVNNNPETVSTDFDTGDRLYFDPLNPESVDHIIETEKPDGCLVQFGGQTAIKLAKHMDDIGLPILGTPADAIDEAEDRERFDELLAKLDIPRPKGETVLTKEEAVAAANRLGFPVLLRPSYVLGGQNMIIAHETSEVEEYMDIITSHMKDNLVLIDKYMMGKEVEVDAICDGEDYLIPGIMEHIERAGIHSGDSISVYPAQTLSQRIKRTIIDYTGRLARALKVVGLVNIQYVIYNDEVYVIEVNPRSSRTIPYISKVTGVPMVEIATRMMFGEKLRDQGYGIGLYPEAEYVAVKVPVFSFEKLHDVDTLLGPEMKSTGEVLGIAKTFEEALYKGLVAAGYKMKHEGGVLVTVRDTDKQEVVPIVEKFEKMGFNIYATAGTALTLNQNMIAANTVRKIEEEEPNILTLFDQNKIDYIITTSKKGRKPQRHSVQMRRRAVERSIVTMTALDTANALANSLMSKRTLNDVDLVDITKI
jgi:carbamoyl-phosphate synthase large subunit